MDYTKLAEHRSSDSRKRLSESFDHGLNSEIIKNLKDILDKYFLLANKRGHSIFMISTKDLYKLLLEKMPDLRPVSLDALDKQDPHMISNVEIDAYFLIAMDDIKHDASKQGINFLVHNLRLGELYHDPSYYTIEWHKTKKHLFF